MSRDGAKLYNLSSYIAESELLNIIQGLGSNSPLLTSKLKNYNLNSTNYLGFLRHISNTGQGEAWQNFIRGYFNTPYIKNDINTTSELFASSFLNQPKSQPNVDIKDSSQIKQYFAVDNVIEPFTIVDIYPTTNLKWDQTYLANGSGLTNAQNVFFTSKVLNYDIENKQIVNFDDTNNENKILMQLRDFKPGIRAPGMWGFFGGGIEKNETSLFAAYRELYEELNIREVYLVEISPETEIYDLNNVKSTAFSFFIKLEIEEIKISEGVDMKFVNYKEICSGEIYSEKLKKKFPVVKTFYIKDMVKKSINYWKIRY